MYCTTKTLKYILFLFNFLCAMLGLVLIWFGVLLQDTTDEVVIDHGENVASVLTIMLGIVVFITAIFGCVSVFMESKSMLICYAVVLILLLVIQIVLLSISYAAANDGLPDGLKQGFDEMWDKNEQLNSSLSQYEEWLKCCGRNSAQDYFLLEKIPPSSCCQDHDCTKIQNLYMHGCEQKFKDYVKTKTENFNTLSWSLIIVECVGSILACVLVDSIRSHRDRRRFYS